MRVAEAILAPAFLDGSAAIEYTSPDLKRYAGYAIRQVSIARPLGESLFTVGRHRDFKATLSDPWPPWRVTRGSGVGPGGFYGLWLPHIQTLLADCHLVALADDDRVPSARWVWLDNFRNNGHYEEQRSAQPLRKGKR